jgi:NADH:ubiquinone oxidoreductase subunit 3 (subunit A)
MILEIMIAFALILAVVSVIYAIGHSLSPKTKRNENQEESYACGEKAVFGRLTLDVSLYRYLVFFLVVDSSVLLVAFASIALGTSGFALPLFLGYLVILVVAIVLLVKGGKI